MKYNPLPSQALLKEWLDYDPESGVFRWKKESRPNGPRRAGKRAGWVTKFGYVSITVAGYVGCRAHRLAWVYVYGDMSDELSVDHRDLNKSNNAISNLRIATRSQQNQNRPLQSNNSAGLKGVSYRPDSGNWRSRITVGKATLSLGHFETAEQAHAAYCEAAEKYHGEFARTA